MKVLRKFLFRFRIHAETVEEFDALRRQAEELYGSWAAAVAAHPELEELRRRFRPTPAELRAGILKMFRILAGTAIGAFLVGVLFGLGQLGANVVAAAWR